MYETITNFTTDDRARLERIEKILLGQGTPTVDVNPFSRGNPPAPPPPPPVKPFPNSREAFWASQPPEVQALRKINSQPDRLKAAQDLARKGFLIVRKLHVNDMDPKTEMESWLRDGYTMWYPGILNNNTLHPNYQGSFPNAVAYDPMNPPAGSFPIDLTFAEGYEN